MKSKRRKLHHDGNATHEKPQQQEVGANTNNLPADIVTPNFAKLASTYPEFATEWINLKKRQQQTTSRNQSPSDPVIGASIGVKSPITYTDAKTASSTKKRASSFSTHVDFEFNAALTRAILCEYFQLSLPSLPKGYLCPPIPNRLNYVLWIKDLLRETFNCNNEYFEAPLPLHNHEGENVEKSTDEKQSTSNPSHYKYCSQAQSYRGMDIGCGASCIYPLLLSSKYFDQRDNESKKKWEFLGTEIDPYSIQCAQQNVDANQLQNQIKLALVPPTPDQTSFINKSTSEQNKNEQKVDDSNNDGNKNDTIDALDKLPSTPIHTAMKAASTIYSNTNSKNCRFDFCMTNPPFYATVEEATAPRAGDERNRTPMTTFESVYPGNPIGGEVKFVLDMIHGSLHHKNDITWFTAMLGKKSSLIPIEKELESLGLSRACIRKTEFVQGKHIRWGIAWTFRHPAIRSKVALIEDKVMSFNVKFDKPLLRNEALNKLSNRINVFCAHNKKGSELKFYHNGEDRLTVEDLFQPSIKASDKKEVKTQNQIIPHHQLLIDMYVENQDVGNGNNGESGKTDSVTIRLECYCHHKSAMGRIHNLRNQLTGEIARTNRRWRRRSK
mmetsp:Transcript_15053/g.22755  ORF Transcript_15053/g.22755 Transcript_15053/m.22755 type:complete len:611 (+) Transcript_15053:14-1846(+)